MLSRASSTFKSIDRGTIPVELVRQSPGINAAHVEPDEPLKFFFNRQVEPERVEIQVRETLHGFVYDSTAEENDIRGLSAVERVRVDKDSEPVIGRTQNLPGNRVFEFFPSKPWTYGATIEINVLVDETPIVATRFDE